MGWATDLHDASFRSVPFECTTISDSLSKTIAIHQAPYSDDASIEDMGNEPRRVSVQGVYAGEVYLTWVTALEAALLDKGAGELVHPIFGITHAQVVNYTINHDVDGFDSCTYSIDFTIKKPRKLNRFIPIQTPQKIDSFSIIANPASSLEKTLLQLKNKDNNAFFKVINNIRNGLHTVRNYLGIVKNTVEDLLSPATWAIGLVDDISQLVTFNTNISAISKWRDIVKRIQRFEKLFDTDDSPAELKQLWRATQVASVIAITQNAVTTVRKEMAENNEISFNPVELAVIRQQNRQKLQQTINIERGQPFDIDGVYQVQVYKEIADQVHLQLQELIEIRPPITTALILVTCTLHWLAHFLYGDMRRANEIRHLNPDLVNPALLLKGMEITVYAR